MPPSRRRRSRLLLVVMTLVLGVVVVEGMVRYRQWSRYGTAGATFYKFEDDPVSGLRIPAPGVTEGKFNRIEVDERGFRGPGVEMPKPEGRIRLAFLGGSTTFCAEASDNDATWPALVCARLRELYPGFTFDYVNAGVGGFSAEQSRVNLEKRVAPMQPDVIFVYHATNDLTADTRALAKERGLPGTEDHEPSWLAELSLAWLMVEKNLFASSSSSDEKLEYDAEALAAGFGERLDVLLDECLQVAPVAVLITFSHHERRDQTPEELAVATASSRHYMPFLGNDGILDGFEAYNAAIRAVGARPDVVLIDGEESIPGDPEHFNDSVHLTDVGCRLQSKRVVDQLTASPSFAALLQP